MTTEQITENNRIIAEFIGFEMKHKINYIPSSLPNCMKNAEHLLVDNPNNMPFHTSFDWLMPVIDRIERLVFENDVFYNFNILGGCQVSVISSDGDEIIDTSKETKLLSIYDAVIQFINWYNQQKQ